MSTPPLWTTRISVPDTVLVEFLDGKAILLHLDTEQYFGLDDVGTRMWSALTTLPTLRDAYDLLLDEYDVTPEQLQHDLFHFAGQLAARRLVQFHEHVAEHR